MTTNFEPLYVPGRRLLLQFPESSDLGHLEIRAAGDLTAEFTYHDSEPNPFWIRFNRAYAYRYLTQSLCTEFHVDHSIDQLVELTESEWRDQILSQARISAPLRHYMFFAEDHGALEVLAVDYEIGGRPPLPPEYQPEENDE